MTRARLLVTLALTAMLAVALAACGGDDEPAAQTTNVDQLLQETFSGDEQVTSGRLDLSLRVAAQGKAAAGLDGPVALRLSGPFESEGDGRLPAFDLDAEVRGGGQTLSAGATSTGDAGYVSFQGQDFELAGPVFAQFKAGYEEAQKQNGSQGGHTLAQLGIDPRRWLEDARVAGEAKVGDADTIRITGRVDVPALLDDLDSALERAGALGIQGAARLPDGLTAAQRRQIEQAVERADVEIYTGRDDHILRRLRVDLRVADRKAGSGTVRFDVSLTDVNEGQDISAPGDARPFDELVGRLRGLGLALGAAGAAAGSGGTEGLERYSRCVADAGGDAAAVRRCVRLLAP